MSNPTNETFGQARQGSVAAIIQILNERLADAGIRTRAVVDGGVLQVLCEAPSKEHLDQSTIVDRVRQILESISPQRISKVNINSRIVKEDQLLWLEEINRDPENALLWSEMITLKRPFFIQRWIRDRNLKPAGPVFRDITEPDPREGNLQRNIIGGVGLATLVLATGWLFRDDLSQIQQGGITTADAPAEPASGNELPPLPEQAAGVAPALENEEEEAPNATTSNPGSTSAADPNAGDRTADTTPQTPPPNEPPSPTANPTPNQPPTSSGATADAFAEAVRIANQASTDGVTAESVAEWLDLATRWQRASDLMAQIPAGSEQYTAAQERVTSYAQNSEMALAQAAALQ
ncbi:MAG: hypothetical protein AAFO84_01655 [Cyanobacteria bacterium J06598_1]